VDETLAQVAEAEADLKNQLVVNVTELQGEQTALIDRFQVVLNALDAKGGDSTSYRKYIEAINAIELDITDTEGLGVRLMTWLQSEEGGLRLGLSIGKFLGILLLAIALAPLIGMTVDKSLSRLNNALLRQFMVGLVKRGTVIVGFLLAVTSLGVSLGPLLALVGGVSFVLAFALQSNIGNFASGVMLMLYKPFDVGDRVLIPGTGLEASVREITLANTSFEHYSGKIITVPNATVWGSNIENIIPGEDRLLEYLFMIGSDADARAMKTVWDEVIENHPAINKDKWYMSMPYLSASSGSLMYWCGAFTSKQGYWTVYEEVLMGLWDGLKAAGVSFGINKEESYIRLVNGTFTENGFKLNNNGEHSEGTTVTAAAKPALVGSRKAPDLIDVDKDGLDNPDFD
ncbi:MAG: mechanosensitive ion channel family protein, partial [Jaaginema sp. PMC 1079.18]|nr:mechanosensitive ion channel family protein [Jaaginema sp. PMC 1079.18]